MKKSNDNGNRTVETYIPIGMCLGCGIGMLFGKAVFDNISLGMCLGMSVGMGLGAILSSNLYKKSMTVIEIIEDDFGCEGIPEDAEAMVTVVVADAKGKEQQIRMADKLCYERNIKLGDSVTFDEDGNLKVVK